MITYDVELFKNLLFSLQPLIKTSITFYDENFEGTMACTSPMNPLCRYVKDYWDARCKQSDAKAMDVCRRGDFCDHHYCCHFGLKEMAFRMTNHGENYGYILIGPFRNTSLEKQVMHSIDELCAQHPIDKADILKAYYSVASFSIEKFESIKVIIHALFDYAVNKNIISMKHTLFETVITSYVNEHLSDDLSITALCRHFYLSPKQLLAVTKKATGMSPKQYVTQQRIEEAKRLISTTDAPIPTIAETVGIPDYSYFIKVFKSATGHTPTHYRKNN